MFAALEVTRESFNEAEKVLKFRSHGSGHGPVKVPLADMVPVTLTVTVSDTDTVSVTDTDTVTDTYSRC